MISFLKKYLRKFQYAFQGLFDGIAHDRSILTQCCIGIIVLLVCCFLPLSLIEWSILLLVIGAVIALEYVNSAIETVTDMISPEYSKQAKKVKDYAAAAVLVMSLAALGVAICIIGGNVI